MRSTLTPIIIVLALSTPASAQVVDACTIFTAAMAQAIVGVPVTQSRNTPGRASGSCEFKDTSGTEIILFTLWRLPSAEEGSRYLEAELKTATGVRGGTAEKIPNLGDEAYYLSTTWSLYVRKGVAWFSFGYPFIKKEVLIDLARKVAPKL